MNIKKSTLAVAVSASLLALINPVVADEQVQSYLVSSDGKVVTNGSGDCVRTTRKDSSEYLQDCGYETVSVKASDVSTSAEGTKVTVIEAEGVVKGDKVIVEPKITVSAMVLRNIQFKFDSAELTGDYQVILDEANEFLKPHREALRAGGGTLMVIGHTDSVGNAEYNQVLSEKRAQSVADYLIKLDGTRAAFTKTAGRGESEPVASNDTEEGRQLNRRVVLEVVPN